MPNHHPPHIFLDNSWYVISAATINHARFLARDEAKRCIRDNLRVLVQKFNLSLRAWVILDNHYHLLLKTRQGNDLSTFVRQLHGSTSRHINLLDYTPGRRIWLNYWDSLIRSEQDLWTHFNYIHQNPVKHRYVREIGDWSFSSYGYFSETKRSDWLNDCWERYAVIDFLEGDNFGVSRQERDLK